MNRHTNTTSSLNLSRRSLERHDDTANRLTNALLHPSRSLAWYGLNTHTLTYAATCESRQEEQLLENIKLRVAEVRRRIELMSMEDDVIENVVDKVKQLTSESE